MAKIILALTSMYPLGFEGLESDFEIIRLWKEKDPEAAIHEHRNDILAIIATAGRMVPRKLIEVLPNLEIISNFAVGTDNIDLRAAQERGVIVTNTPDVLTADTADIALSLLLGVARRVVESDVYVRVGKWQSSDVMPLGVSLEGKTVGIVGLGRIGQAIAKRALGFDLNVIYHGRLKKDGVPYTFYPELVAMAQDCDFLVLSCSGGEGTKHIVNADVFNALGKNGFLINVARGSVVDEEALLIALRNKAIAGAGLDVYENEPHVPEVLFSMDNVVLLPHIGASTVETSTNMGQLVIDNIRAHFKGKPLESILL